MGKSLNKMQIDRLEAEMNLKIDKRVRALKAANKPLLSLQKREQTLEDKMKKEVNKAYFKVKPDASDTPYHLDHIKEEVAAMMKLPVYTEWVKATKASERLVVKQNAEIEALQKKLHAKVKSILNDAYFRDAEYALKALESF